MRLPPRVQSPSIPTISAPTIHLNSYNFYSTTPRQNHENSTSQNVPNRHQTQLRPHLTTHLHPRTALDEIRTGFPMRPPPGALLHTLRMGAGKGMAVRAPGGRDAVRSGV